MTWDEAATAVEEAVEAEVESGTADLEARVTHLEARVTALEQDTPAPGPGPQPPTGYPPETTLASVAIPPVSGHLPYREASADPTWGTQRIRVGQAHRMCQFYSRRQAWSRDGSMLLLNAAGKHVVDGDTYVKLGTYGSPGDYPAWSNIHPHRLYAPLVSGNPSTWRRSDSPTSGQYQTVRTFTGWSGVSLGQNEGDASLNDRFALCGTWSGAPGVLVYDAERDVIVGTITAQGTTNNADISHDGEWVAITYQDQGSGQMQGTWLFTAKGARIRQLSTSWGHGDWARLADGRQAWVQIYYGLYVDDVEADRHWYALSGQDIVPYGNGHVSGTSHDDPGWVACGSANALPGKRGNGQVFSVALDGSERVRVYGFHHGEKATPSYDLECQPTLSRDGRRALVRSCWGTKGDGSAGNEVYGYIFGVDV
jgi:hypothetical protein